MTGIALTLSLTLVYRKSVLGAEADKTKASKVNYDAGETIDLRGAVTGGKQGGLQPFPRLSEILNIMLHCRKFLEKLQLIVVV